MRSTPRSPQHVAEIILAILLFVDATDVRGGLLGPDPRSRDTAAVHRDAPRASRRPSGSGLWLLPGLSWAVVLIIGCVVVPIDFAPAASTLRDKRLPERIRSLLNVEAGTTTASSRRSSSSPWSSPGIRRTPRRRCRRSARPCRRRSRPFWWVWPSAPLIALASNIAERRDLMTEQSKRLILVAAPLLAYTHEHRGARQRLRLGVRLRHAPTSVCGGRRRCAATSSCSTTLGFC